MKNLTLTLELLVILFMIIGLLLTQYSLICLVIFSWLQLVCIILFVYQYWQQDHSQTKKIIVSILGLLFTIGFVSIILNVFFTK